MFDFPSFFANTTTDHKSFVGKSVSCLTEKWFLCTVVRGEREEGVAALCGREKKCRKIVGGRRRRWQIVLAFCFVVMRRERGGGEKRKLQQLDCVKSVSCGLANDY